MLTCGIKTLIKEKNITIFSHYKSNMGFIHAHTSHIHNPRFTEKLQFGLHITLSSKKIKQKLIWQE